MAQAPILNYRDGQIATDRTASLFQPDIAANSDKIEDLVKGKNILAIGAAGSIGSNTVHVLQRFDPKSLHIVDHNENALAELVRQLRSLPGGLNVEDFRTLPLNYGSKVMEQFLSVQPTYDVVLNFAAVKHVRSEKDPFSTLQMFDTNILKQDQFLHWLSATGFTGRYFSVSTDKAANPSSLMGATKRVMEHVMFAGSGGRSLKDATITSARFANVAFSNGSLLESFINRFARDEPLACPQNITRYFVSLRESGEICTLASLLAPHGHIAIPRLDPSKHLIPLQDIAEKFIRAQGLNAQHYSDELKAITRVEADKSKSRYPLIITPANTSGEKPYEEFVAKGEKSIEIGLSAMQGVPYRASTGDVDEVIADINTIFEAQDAPVKTETLKAIIAKLEPSFLDTHVVSHANLDQRA